MFTWHSLGKHLWSYQRAPKASISHKRRMRCWRPLLEELERRLVPTNYYVALWGLPGNDGLSCQTPWPSISQVNSRDGQFGPGDVINFESGQTFNGSLQLGLSNGTPTNPIKITSFVCPLGPQDPFGRATINAPDNGTGMKFTNVEGYRVSNINITGYNTGDYTQDGILFANNLGSLSSPRTLRHIYIDNVEVGQRPCAGACQFPAVAFGDYGINVETLNGYSFYNDVNITYTKVHNNTRGGLVVQNCLILNPQNPCSPSETLVQTIQNLYVGHVESSYNAGFREPTPSNGQGNGITLFGIAGCSGSCGAVIERSLIHDNGANGTQPSGIWTNNADHVTMQFIESYNTHDPAGSDGHGFDFDSGTTNSLIQYCYSHGNEGIGYLMINFRGSPPHHDNTFRYNVSENDLRGIQQATYSYLGYGYASIGIIKDNKNGLPMNDGMTNENVYSNTIYQSPTTVGGTTKYPVALAVSADWSSNGTNLNFRNNIIFTTGDATDTSALVYVAPQSGPGIQTLFFQGNDYWTTGTFKIYWRSSMVNVHNLTDWRNFGQEFDDRGQPVGTADSPNLMNAGHGGTIGNADQLGLPGTLTAYQFTPSTPISVTNGGVNIWRMSGHTIDPGPRDWWGDPMPALSDTALYSIGAFQKPQ